MHPCFGSLAGADGWSITNVAAFPIFRVFPTRRGTQLHFSKGRESGHWIPPLVAAFFLAFQHNLWISLFTIRGMACSHSLSPLCTRDGQTPRDKMQWMAVTIDLQNLGNAQLCQEITVHIEHTFADRRGDWRVSIAGTRASENWEMRVEGPNGFERSYVLTASAGEHPPEAIRRILVQLLPIRSS
jgi:hypothetical protein